VWIGYPGGYVKQMGDERVRAWQDRL
jgi:hypothetical protein